MTKLLTILIAAVPIAAEMQTFKVCNDKTCYEVKLDAKSFEWKQAFDGTKFLRVYAPDGTAVDIGGRDLQIETAKKSKKRK